ncbi:MAG: PAS domain-containing protein [Candidatus Didemnitutus sp.]|nr:PAS domain-containing protein [Candidatus Didemnitutus sp.]
MSKQTPDPRDAAELRRRAEERLHVKEAGKSPLSEADAQKLVHELQVHQIELEMQNEELQRARNEIEAGLMKFAELYDFAPISYFTVDPEGTILEANLSAATLLGLERSRLMNRRFVSFVAAAARTDLDGFLARVFASEEKEVCVLQLSGDTVPLRYVQIEAVAALAGKECRLAAMEITESMQAAAEQKRMFDELKATQAKVKALSGLLPICACCKKIRDDQGYWEQIEAYIQDHSDALFSHGICPECLPKLAAGLNDPRMDGNNGPKK